MKWFTLLLVVVATLAAVAVFTVTSHQVTAQEAAPSS